VVLCKEEEYREVQEYVLANGLVPKKQGLTCPWYQEGECKVYPVRPGICRLFGHVERLECKHGRNVNVSGVVKRRAEKALGSPTRCLHEVFPDWKVVLEAGVAFSKRSRAGK
jgi:Fe-S-cluster containining protein